MHVKSPPAPSNTSCREGYLKAGFHQLMKIAHHTKVRGTNSPINKLIFMPVFALVTRSKEKNTECEFRSLQVSLLSYGTTLIASAASLQSWSNLAIICITSLKSLGQNVKNECWANLQVSVGQ